MAKSVAAGHLHIVNADTGEMLDGCEECKPLVEELRVQLKGAEREVRKLRRELHDALRQKDKEARDDPLWDEAAELHGIWARACDHPRCTFDTEQFELIRPFLARKNCGRVACERAIAGAAYDSYTHYRKNGSSHRCDEFERIFGDSKHFYEFANKAPKDWKPAPRVNEREERAAAARQESLEEIGVNDDAAQGSGIV